MVDKKDVTDPFVDVRLGKAKLAKTSVVNNDLNPKWDESYRIEVCHFADALTFEIRDKDHAYSEYIGCVEIPTTDLLNGQVFKGPHPIKSKSGKTKGTLTIEVYFRYVDIFINKSWSTLNALLVKVGISCAKLREKLSTQFSKTHFI